MILFSYKKAKKKNSKCSHDLVNDEIDLNKQNIQNDEI